MYSLKIIKIYFRKSIIPLIQDLYESWIQDDTGYCSVYGFDGIYYEVIETITDFLVENGIVCETVEDKYGNIYTVAKMEDGVFLIGINPNKFQYKSSGKVYKVDDVIFTEDDIKIVNLDSNTNNYEKFISGELSIDKNYLLKESATNTDNYTPQEISIDVENSIPDIINNLINGLSLVIRKRSIKNLRILSIEGVLNKLDISILSYSELKIRMSNGDELQLEFSINQEKVPNIKIMINGTLVFDLDYSEYTLENSIGKLTTIYTKYLQSKNWKIKD